MSKTWNPKSVWDDHPDHPAEDWIADVANGDTRQSYIAWVNHRLDSEETDQDNE